MQGRALASATLRSALACMHTSATLLCILDTRDAAHTVSHSGGRGFKYRRVTHRCSRLNIQLAVHRQAHPMTAVQVIIRSGDRSMHAACPAQLRLGCAGQDCCASAPAPPLHQRHHNRSMPARGASSAAPCWPRTAVAHGQRRCQMCSGLPDVPATLARQAADAVASATTDGVLVVAAPLPAVESA